jgi:hypothetical protein
MTPCRGVQDPLRSGARPLSNARRSPAELFDAPFPSPSAAISCDHSMALGRSPRISGSVAQGGVRGRVEGTRLPAGLCFTSCLPGFCFTSCLPGLCFTSSLPGPCFTSCLPGACFTSCLPGSFLQGRRPPAYRAPPARPAAPRNRARQTRALLPSGTSYRSEKNPPLTHGDPAEAGPPGQSQPSRVHPVKQRAGAMRTRTGARPSSSSCASPVARICAYFPTGSGGGRHPEPRPPSLPPCGIPRQKPSKRRSATPPRIPPLPPPAGLHACPLVQQPLSVARRAGGLGSWAWMVSGRIRFGWWGTRGRGVYAAHGEGCGDRSQR